MNLKISTLLVFSLFFLASCAEYTSVKKNQKEKEYYSSSGFALIYDDYIYLEKIVNKKIDNNKLHVMHNFLRKNSLIRIINPVNDKTIDVKVSKRANYPQIFNIVLSRKIASLLELDSDNPYVEIFELKKNRTFVAKEGTIFDEEKNVANKAPVDEIKVNIISSSKTKNKTKKDEKKKFIIVISDFYYENTAINLKEELIKKSNLKNISVKKINNKKYRLLVGPFQNFKALKTTYISLNNLGFEALNVYRK